MPVNTLNDSSPSLSVSVCEPSLALPDSISSRVAGWRHTWVTHGSGAGGSESERRRDRSRLPSPGMKDRFASGSVRTTTVSDGEASAMSGVRCCAGATGVRSAPTAHTSARRPTGRRGLPDMRSARAWVRLRRRLRERGDRHQITSNSREAFVTQLFARIYDTAAGRVRSAENRDDSEVGQLHTTAHAPARVCAACRHSRLGSVLCAFLLPHKTERLA